MKNFIAHVAGDPPRAPSLEELSFAFPRDRSHDAFSSPGTSLARRRFDVQLTRQGGTILGAAEIDALIDRFSLHEQLPGNAILRTGCEQILYLLSPQLVTEEWKGCGEALKSQIISAARLPGGGAVQALMEVTDCKGRYILPASGQEPLITTGFQGVIIEFGEGRVQRKQWFLGFRAFEMQLLALETERERSCFEAGVLSLLKKAASCPSSTEIGSFTGPSFVPEDSVQILNCAREGGSHTIEIKASVVDRRFRIRASFMPGTWMYEFEIFPDGEALRCE